MTQFNLELHNRIIEQIETHPETWDQKSWTCGTAHCYGGWSQKLSGTPCNIGNIYDTMAEVLGLTYSQAEYSFAPSRTLKDLKDLPDYVLDTGGYDENGCDHLGYDKEGFNKYRYAEDEDSD